MRENSGNEMGGFTDRENEKGAFTNVYSKKTGTVAEYSLQFIARALTNLTPDDTRRRPPTGHTTLLPYRRLIEPLSIITFTDRV